MKFGVDVSNHNGVIDWEKAKAQGIEFVIIRCGIGSNIESQDDKQFERNYSECKRLGIPVGTYLYSYACNTDQARSEADHVLRLVEGKNFELGIWFDMEDADNYKSKRGVSNSTMVDICETFCNIIESKGLKTGIYSSTSWFNHELNDSRLDKFDKWVAHWAKQCTYQKPYSIWQFGGETNLIRSNKIDGIGGSVDMNYLVNENLLSNTQTTHPQTTRSIIDLAHEVIAGKWGNGEERKQKLGSLYNEVQAKVNELLSMQQVEYYPACNSKYVSIVDALDSIKVDSSFENRKKIAQKNNVRDYKGTAVQNNRLLDKLKAGKLIK